MSDETESILREILAVLKADSPSEKERRHSAHTHSILSTAPKVFKTCGHKFPSVSLMTDGEGCMYEQRYTCKECGATELWP